MSADYLLHVARFLLIMLMACIISIIFKNLPYYSTAIFYSSYYAIVLKLIKAEIDIFYYKFLL